jgi:CheY-like chemotaxis protein
MMTIAHQTRRVTIAFDRARDRRECPVKGERMVDVVVLNSSEETAQAIESALQFAGWSTTHGFVVDFKRNRMDFTSFITKHDPRVIVWDIAIPYAENWTYYQTVRTLPCTTGRGFVLTCTNVRVLAELVGTGSIADLAADGGVLEIVGKPFDLDQLTDAVREVWTAPPPPRVGPHRPARLAAR